MANFDGTDDYFDSREVIERIAELEAEFVDATDTDPADLMSEDDWAFGLGEDGAAELVALIALRDEAGDGTIPDFEYGETFISDDHFQDYAEELAYDIGAIDRNATWPLNRIDWAAAADDLKSDYTSFEFRGTTYWAR
jgi:hypothetical protein